MSEVVMPQHKAKESGFGKLFTTAGAVVGGIYGGPQGAALGAGLGQTAAGVLDTSKPPAQVNAVQSNAMQRRMSSMDAGNQNVAALREADSALMALPPAQAAQYAPAIKKARGYAEQEIA